MATAIDGFNVFKTIGKNPELFAALRVEVNKQAIGLLTKQLAKCEPAQCRELYKVIGEDDLYKVIDSMKSVAAPLKKLDPYADLKAASDRDKRAHLLGLIKGDIHSTPKPEKAKKAKTSKSASLMGVKSMKSRPKKTISIKD